MPNRPANRRSPFAKAVVPGPRRRDDREGARQRTPNDLLEAAGHVFAEKGLDGATGKEICERAGTNTAAVNYYFGGMEGLYAAVLEEANRRMVPLETLSSAVAGKPDARAKLQAIIELALDRVLGPASSSWVLGVISREVIAPSAAIDKLIDKQGLPKARIIKSIVGELMALPPEHPAVALGCLSIGAPFLMMLIGDRRTMKRMFPSLTLRGGDTAGLSRYMLQYALAGLAALAREVRKTS
jgi:AcrR family transcriptional regulator